MFENFYLLSQKGKGFLEEAAQKIQETGQKVQRAHKEYLIAQSGSTKEGQMERVRSGQSYLYKSKGMDSEIFEVKLKENINGTTLNQAIQRALSRFPYMNTRMVELDGDFYIVQNPTPILAYPTQNLNRLGGLLATQHLIEITYYEHSIYIAFHHALCDGRGVKAFIETLIYYYCQLTYHSQASAEGIRLRDQPLLPGETEDAFWNFYDYDSSKEFPQLSRDAYALPESHVTDEETEYRYEILINQADYMKVAKAHHATPVILLSLAISRMLAKLYPDFDKPINANIATDMREALGMSNTYKNCVKSMILPYTRDNHKESLATVATYYRELLQAQKDPDFCKHEANNIVGLLNKLDEAPTYEAKQDILSFIDSFILNTYTISYIGQFILNENEQYVDSIHLYCSGTVGLSVNMICASGKFMIDIKQNFADDKYVRNLLAEFAEMGLTEIQVSDAIPFSTPKDAIVKREE